MSESSRDGVQSWTESMSARDRIRAVAETLREPRSVNWISEQADAAWSTTSEELQDLVDQGQLRRVETGETTRYQPDYTRSLFEEIRTLIEENTREELRNELAAITEEIEEWQATYDVETWEELEQSLADGDLASDELRERRDVIAFWRENEADRRLIKHALELYSDVEAAREQLTDVADRATSEFSFTQNDLSRRARPLYTADPSPRRSRPIDESSWLCGCTLSPVSTPPTVRHRGCRTGNLPE